MPTLIDTPHQLAAQLRSLCLEVSAAILAIYNQPQHWETQQKQDDSPVTLADLTAHRMICAWLQHNTPDIPILSEESNPETLVGHQHWHTLWLLDPLDGTREFLQRNGQFTINLALIRRGQPVFGFIHHPISQTSYYGGAEIGSYRETPSQAPSRLNCRRISAHTLTVMTSQRHGLDALSPLLDQLRNQGFTLEQQMRGSALKFFALVEGQADLYPRLSPTGEWDTAAGQALLEGAGGQLLNLQGEPLRYNQKTDWINPSFIAIADPTQPWFDWIETPPL